MTQPILFSKKLVIFPPHYLSKAAPEMTNVSLPLLSCYFVELPDDKLDCSPSGDTCVRCKFLGRFWAGGALDEFGSPGHVVSLLEWMFTFVIGICGVITNSLIVAIIKRQKSGRAFDTFLMTLACFDLLGSLMAVVGSTSTVVMFENWGRGIYSHYFVFFGTFTCYFARTGSSLLTLMITFERYVVIAFPMQTSRWFTVPKTRTFCALMLLLAAFLAYPRFASFKIADNTLQSIPSIQNHSHLFLGTPQQKFWYSTLGAATSIFDFWVPLPLLLILNILVCLEIRKFTRRRKEMSLNRRKEINAVKMFIPVVVMLFICNVVGYFHWYYVVFENYAYREIFLGLFVSVALNSFVNFFFYMKNDVFRSEFRALMRDTKIGGVLRGVIAWESSETTEKKTQQESGGGVFN